MVVCVVHNRDKGKVMDELVRAGFKFTVVASTGGFLREGNTTLLIGTEEGDLGLLKEVVSANCQTREQVVNVVPFEAGATGSFIPSPIKVPVGGATLFVLNVEEFAKF